MPATQRPPRKGGPICRASGLEVHGDAFDRLLEPLSIPKAHRKLQPVAKLLRQRPSGLKREIEEYNAGAAGLDHLQRVWGHA